MIQRLFALLRSEVGRGSSIIVGSVVAATILVGAYGTVVSSGGPTCDQTISSNLSGALAAATGGSTICLNTASYGTLTLSNYSKGSTVTVRPASGATPSIGSVSLDNVDFLTITGSGGSMSIGGFSIDTSGSGASTGLATNSNNVTISNATMTGTGCIRARADTPQTILFDSLIFNGLGQGCNEGRLGFLGCTTSSGICPFTSSASSGVTVSNSTFSSGGCSDGVQATQEATGFTIGPGNEFTGIIQGSCAPVHADPIQFYGAHSTTVTGNYFHDNGDGTGGIASFDGFGEPTTVTNNVFKSNGIYPYIVAAWGAQGWLVSHNTFYGSSTLRFQNSNGGTAPSGNSVVNNVFASGSSLSVSTSGYGTNSYNLNSGRAGTGEITGTPVFQGGSPPTTYLGYRLSAGSPGENAASDGTNMGIP